MIQRCPRGFTAIELLVAILLVGVLVALLFPAVQTAREAARRASCSNNLRQMGVALNSYYAAYEAFPYYVANYRYAPPSGIKTGPVQLLSAQVRLLPYLEQATLFHAINVDLQQDPRDGVPANETAASITLSVYLCPSDGSRFTQAGGNSYRASVGIGPQWGPNMESPDSGNGFFDEKVTLMSASLFVDGLSNTVAFSERLRGSGLEPNGQPERDYSNLMPYPEAALRTADYALQWCRVAAIQQGMTFTQGGASWLEERRENTSFCHGQEPNGRIPDALARSYPTSWGISTARSWHHGGVFALTGDGATSFVLETIDRRVWRALGTRSGGETTH